MGAKRSTGSVYLRDTPRTGPGWYVTARLIDGRRIHRRLGPAWTGRTKPATGYITKKQAKAALRDLLSDADRGILDGDLAPSSDRTFGDAVSEWLRHREHDKQVAPSTLADYQQVARLHLLPEFGADTPLSEITKERIEEYRDKLLASGASRRNSQKTLVLLSGILKRAKRRGWIAANPCEDVERITVKASGHFNKLDPAQVAAVARAASDPTMSAAILTAAYSGLRLGEIRGLQWGDVDFASSVIHVRRAIGHFGTGTPKSGKVRSVPLIDQAAVALDGLSRRDHFTRPDDAVFCDVVGKPLRDDTLRKGLYAALKAAGLGHLRDPDRQPYPFRFHDLRHSFGTLAVNVWDLPRVQMYMGHSDVATTSIYIHSQPRHSDADQLSRLVAAACAPDDELCAQRVTK